MTLTSLEILNEDLKQRSSNWKIMVKHFSDDYEPDAQYYVFQAGYKVVLKQLLHQKTLTDLAYFKMLIDNACEALDDDTAKYETGEKLNDGTKLNAYNFLKDMNNEYKKLIVYATAIEMVQKCGNNRKKIKKHYRAYYEQVKSKLDKMVEDAKKGDE